MIPFPNTVAPFVNKLGRILAPFNFYLQQFTQAPPNAADIIATGSPLTYTAKEPGLFVLNGGTVLALNLVRGSVSIDVLGMKAIPMSIQDLMVVQYSVAPSMLFLASYGQNTGNQ